MNKAEIRKRWLNVKQPHERLIFKPSLTGTHPYERYFSQSIVAIIVSHSHNIKQFYSLEALEDEIEDRELGF